MVKRSYKGLLDILYKLAINNDLNDSTIEDINSLLGKGADPNVRNQNGWTPLHFAAEICNTEIVNALVKHVASVDAISCNGWTPLHLAAKNNHKDVVEALLNNKAEVNAVNNDG